MIVGCYQLDLYCDFGLEEAGYGDKCPHKPLLRSCQGEYYGHSEKVCMKQARKDGWTFDFVKRLAYCPGCSKTNKLKNKRV